MIYYYLLFNRLDYTKIKNLTQFKSSYDRQFRNLFNNIYTNIDFNAIF